MNEDARDYDTNNEPRPRPRRYDDSYDRPRSPEVSVLGVISLVIGFVSLPLSFIPCIGVFGMIAGGVGLLLGMFGIAVARSSGNQGLGLPISGTIVNLFAILIGTAWLFLINAVANKAAADFQGALQPPAAVADEPEAVQAAALDTEYNTNELTADVKYKGKVLIVTGKVSKVTRDDKPGKITVELDGAPRSTVDCHFDRTRRLELAGLEVGQEVTIRGQCKGKVENYVTLNTCSLVKDLAEKQPDGPPVPVAVDVLDKDYRGNAVAADKKYKGKLLIVTGKVARVARNKPGLVTVEMGTEQGPNVECDFATKDAVAQLVDLAVGDSVVIRGTCRGLVDNTVVMEKCSNVTQKD